MKHGPSSRRTSLRCTSSSKSKSRVCATCASKKFKNQVGQRVFVAHFAPANRLDTTEEFYGIEDFAVHNVDVMTDASAFTAFTRYTTAPTTSAASRTTKRTSRSKRKMERKVSSGRKGTVDEEEYLLKSLTKLAGRLATTQGALHALSLFRFLKRSGSNIRH